MKRSFFAVLALGLALVGVLSLVNHSNQVEVSGPALATNGAFRDGMYQARMDAQLNRKPKLRTGRWSSDADRAWFVAGYQQASGNLFGNSRQSSQGLEFLGFREGTADGAKARTSDQPFELRSAEFRLRQNQREAKSESVSKYFEGYANGYKYGYYVDQEILESQLTGQPVNRF